jgi:hypothetical protein
MTRCVCCDRKLKDHEAVRRHAITNDFLDICDTCLKEISNIPTKLPKGVVIEADPFEDAEASDNDADIDSVTHCYTLDLDKDS